MKKTIVTRVLMFVALSVLANKVGQWVVRQVNEIEAQSERLQRQIDEDRARDTPWWEPAPGEIFEG